MLTSCQSWGQKGAQDLDDFDDAELFDDADGWDDDVGWDDDPDMADSSDGAPASRLATGVTAAPVSVKKDQFGLPHPGVPNDKATSQLLMVFNRPPDEQLQECEQEVVALAQQSANGESLVQMMQTMSAAVSRNRSYYHWCFYRHMMTIDQYLKGSLNKASVKQRLDYFLERMRGQWILGRALDLSSNDGEYFHYLRSRYVELSRHYFARQLEVVAKPLGERRRSSSPVQSKPASKFREGR